MYEQFKKIIKLDDFLKFLPQTKSKFSIIDEKYIPFYLSILTLTYCKKVHFKQYALEQLYDFMKDKENRNNLEKDFNFSHMNLYDISANLYKNMIVDKIKEIMPFSVKK